ncbi:redox-sensing transcriptional repressor rex [Marinitoga sp. 1135]|uniref:Redox-sensing transcriptional repressor Rex n=1 Tax=Marinitoga piezophila (strain DSM 14283 / JCM 11233 / KA3) TaxID=443254 RepID=H2J4F3_MARPK|nr:MULTISPECIES: redox-sensing transcriptional repressor Rex [Marinitoga]AEX84808.1 AT-rich DNA-binding protein [Marinitoga piezophila KA3]NUU95051.1 redox-sensing transcriptional repressor rex [Marinitoga sp. 1135]NUU97005.1 redox-sensing transcriptional repressor rex [Marinitoga sp. 1138]
MKNPKIPKPTIKRLAIYYRCLENKESAGIKKTSSKDLAESLGIKASQIRKDLSYFGEFGKRGVGYDIPKLMKSIKNILGLHRRWNVAIIGVGNLGSAIANYTGLEQNGFFIKAAFDKDKKKIGTQIAAGVLVYDIKELKKVCSEKNIEIAILSVPGKTAQKVADQLVETGIKGILNFTPIALQLPENIAVENVDFTVSLKALTYEIVSQYKEIYEVVEENNNNTEEQ